MPFCFYGLLQIRFLPRQTPASGTVSAEFWTSPYGQKGTSSWIGFNILTVTSCFLNPTRHFQYSSSQVGIPDFTRTSSEIQPWGTFRYTEDHFPVWRSTDPQTSASAKAAWHFLPAFADRWQNPFHPHQAVGFWCLRKCSRPEGSLSHHHALLLARGVPFSLGFTRPPPDSKCLKRFQCGFTEEKPQNDLYSCEQLGDDLPPCIWISCVAH